MAGERLSPIEQLIRADRLKTIEQCAQIAESGKNNERYADVEEIAAAIRSIAQQGEENV